MEILTKEQIKEIIKLRIKDYLISIDEHVNITDKTILLGEGSAIDSMGLVNIIIDIESCLKNLNYSIILTSEKAFSKKNSPFRSVNDLADFIFIEIKNYGKK